MRWSPRRVLSRVGLLALAGIAACGKDEASAPLPTEFTLALSPAALTLKQGEAGAVNAVATITSGPATDFTFSVDGAPAGVSMTPPPAPIGATSPGSATGSHGVIVAANTAPGTYPITIKAKTKGGAEKTATFTLTVVLPPSFAIAVSPATQTVSQNGSGGAVVTITRTNFTAPVQLLLEDNPPGVTGTFIPASVSGTTSVLSLVIGPTVQLGTYPIVVRARSPGFADRTASFSVTVTAAPNFTVSLKAPSLTITAGASATDSVFLSRTNYPDGVGLTFESPVAGITGTFNPGATTGASSVLTVSVASTVPPGAYTTIVRGSAPAVGDRDAILTVRVAAPAPAYTLTLVPATLSVEAGQSGSTGVTLGRTNFTGAVDLALEAPPAGIVGTFTPASTTGTTSQLALSVATSVAAGTYPLTVKGTAQGLADRTASLTLTVTPAPSSIAVAARPESLFVFQGSQATTTVSLTRNNFGGSVSLAASGAPGGMAVSFGTNPVTGSSSTMTIAPDGTVPAGRYVITVTASGAGVANAAQTVPVNVTAAGSGNTQFTFCDPVRKPVFFAFQDSTGAWTPVTPTIAGSVNKYYFNLLSDRGGVAWVVKRTVTTPRVAASLTARRTRLAQADAVLQRSEAMRVATARLTAFARPVALAGTADVYDTYVYYLTRAEMATVGQDVCTTLIDTKTNLANVAGVSAGQVATMSLGGSSQSFVGGSSTSPVTFTNVPTRPVDFVGARYSAANGFDKGYLVRSLAVPDGGTLPSLVDFEGPNAFAPAVSQATIGNTAGQTLQLNSLFFTANGEAGVFGVDASPSTQPVRIWSGVPSARMAAGDLHGLLAIALSGTSTNDFRSLLQYVGPVGTATLTLGNEMDLVGVTPAGVFGDPRYRVTAQTLPVGLRNAVDVYVSQSSASANTYRMLATGAYLTASGVVAGFDLTMPPLAPLTGFPTASRLTAGANDVRVSGMGWSGTGILAPRPVVGDQLRIGSRLTTVTVP